MKVGAIVRCRTYHHLDEIRNKNPFDKQGLLLEYDKLMKTATVLLYCSGIKKFRAHDVQLVKNPN
jgi:hypothetical protein